MIHLFNVAYEATPFGLTCTLSYAEKMNMPHQVIQAFHAILHESLALQKELAEEKKEK